MDEPKIAQTWEECAAHIEAGGVVEIWSGGCGPWVAESHTADHYRRRSYTLTDESNFPRRLLPIVPAEQPSVENAHDAASVWPEQTILTPDQAATLANLRDEVNRRGPDEVLSGLREAACSVMGREDVLSRLHLGTRQSLGDLIVDLAMLLDAPEGVRS